MFEETLLPLVVIATLLTVIAVFFMIVSLIMLKNRQNKKNKQYLQSLIEDRERTMYTISLEVHDNLNQMLNVARMNVHLLSDDSVGNSPELIRQLATIIDTLILDAHNISHTLNSEYLLKKGLISSLDEEVQWVNNSRKLECVMSVSGRMRYLHAQTELMIFRIAQEAINNVLKYAEASLLRISLYFGARDFIMDVTDNGKGFQYSGHHFQEGVGMQSMRQRAKIIGGTLEIISADGKGSSIILQCRIN